jgi:hypothetical protein
LKNREIKIKPKKVKVDSDKWLQIAKAIVKSKEKEFSLLTRLWKQWITKKPGDPERDACKEVIKHMEQKKTSLEEAQQLAVESAQKLQGLQKELPKVLVYLLGGGTMLICAFVFLVLRAPKSLNPQVIFTNTNVILWLIVIAINVGIVAIGLKKRKVFAKTLAHYSILSQSAAAFAGSRAPGRGSTSFEALHLLDIIRDKNKKAFNDKFGFGGGKKK